MEEIHRRYLHEIFMLIAASLFAAFILSLNVHLPIIKIEETLFLQSFFYMIIIFGVFIAGQKLVAYSLDCITTTKLMAFRQYWFRPLSRYKSGGELKAPFPVWLILPLVLTLLTNGIIKWLAILNFDVETTTSRIRKRWKEITEYDVAKIAVAGPLSLLLLGIISKILGFDSFAMLCAWVAFLSIIPIGAGFKLLMSSRILWTFAFILIGAILLLIKTANAFITVIIAILFAALITIIYYALYEK